MAYGTGHLATLALSTSTINGLIRGMSLGNTAIPVVDRTGLATTTVREKIPGDLAEPEQISVPFLFDSDSAIPAKGVVETATITFPLLSGQSGAATYVGTGFIVDVKLPNLETDTVQEGMLVFQFDGLTGPTFTAAT